MTQAHIPLTTEPSPASAMAGAPRHYTEADSELAAQAPAPVLDAEKLVVYHLALELQLLASGLVPGHHRVLQDQLERASLSVVLNIAEGAGRRSSKGQAAFLLHGPGFGQWNPPRLWMSPVLGTWLQKRSARPRGPSRCGSCNCSPSSMLLSPRLSPREQPALSPPAFTADSSASSIWTALRPVPVDPASLAQVSFRHPSRSPLLRIAAHVLIRLLVIGPLPSWMQAYALLFPSPWHGRWWRVPLQIRRAHT